MRNYSILIFIDKPHDISPLMEGLSNQTLLPYEVIVVEECVSESCGLTVHRFKNRLNVKYFNKHNSGAGYTRNFGFNQASGNYFIVLDAHCMLPEDYLQNVDNALNHQYLDFFAGGVRATERATLREMAISFSLNIYYSIETIRGKLKEPGRLHFRPFNIGLSRDVFTKTEGYLFSEHGEDIEFALRVMKSGFKVGTIDTAYVYHDRIHSFNELFKEMAEHGVSRINVYRFFPEELKSIHFFPVVFLMLIAITLVSLLFNRSLFLIMISLFAVYFIFLFLHSMLRTGRLGAAILSIPATLICIAGYGWGFISEAYREFSGSAKAISDP